MRYKKQIKYLGVTIVALFAFVGFSGSVLIANGSINWDGATDVTQTINNLNQIEVEAQKVVQSKNQLEQEIQELSDVLFLIGKEYIMEPEDFTYPNPAHGGNYTGVSGLSPQGEQKLQQGYTKVIVPKISLETGRVIDNLHSGAFRDNPQITEVILRPDITRLNSMSLYGQGITKVTAPTHLKSEVEKYNMLRNKDNTTLNYY